MNVTLYRTNSGGSFEPKVVRVEKGTLPGSMVIMILAYPEDGTIKRGVWTETKKESEDSLGKLKDRFGLTVTEVPESDPSKFIASLGPAFKNIAIDGTSIIKRIAKINIFSGITKCTKHRTRTVDDYTFDELKSLWKGLGRSGFSSKSKEDLMDGFIEHTVEKATSPAAEQLLEDLPDKLLVAEDRYSGGDIDPNLSIAIATRINSDAVYNRQSTPDLSIQQIASNNTVFDLADIYGEAGFINAAKDTVSKQGINSVADAIQALSQKKFVGEN